MNKLFIKAIVISVLTLVVPSEQALVNSVDVSIIIY